MAKAAGSTSWIPPIWNPAFFMANAMVGLVWIAILAAALIRMAARSEMGLRRSRSRRLKSRLEALSNCPDEEFLSSAATCLCLLLNLESRPLEAEARLKEIAKDEVTKTTLLDLLARDAEAKYSFGRAQIPDAAMRGRILEALKKIAP
jgi:hypothetical protein